MLKASETQNDIQTHVVNKYTKNVDNDLIIVNIAEHTMDTDAFYKRISIIKKLY